MALRGRLGRYRLVRRLAVGGMAEVYLAVAEGLSGFEKRVVVKRLLPQHGREGELVAMFLDEARLVASLRHPNIGEVYDVGAEGSDYFFAMEHIPGRDVRDLLSARYGEPLPLAEAVAIVMGVAEGLHHAHEQRDEAGVLLEIVHRDVSPSNVLVGVGGQVKLIDFGVAKWGAQRTETRHGVLKGKCAYMSPEQCRADALDRRSDVFSLGVLLYEITTGTRPFSGDNDFEVMTAIVDGRVEAPSARWPGYPPGLEPIVLRALSPRREDRHATAEELSKALTEFAAKQGVVPSAAGLAALLAATFGDEASGAIGADRSAGHELAATADTRPARPAAAVDRTATDHQAGAAIRPLVEPGSEALRAVTARRIALVAGVGLACVGAVAVAAPWFRKAPATAVAAPRVVEKPAAVVKAAVAPEAGPTTTTTTFPTMPVVDPPVVKRRTKKVAPPVAPTPEAKVKVWDPDSPVPPPP
jgi:tRNA A-37 threonylcarbamoyl transferase component Bud32